MQSRVVKTTQILCTSDMGPVTLMVEYRWPWELFNRVTSWSRTSLLNQQQMSQIP